jgi:hypothetical protein
MILNIDRQAGRKDDKAGTQRKNIDRDIDREINGQMHTERKCF